MRFDPATGEAVSGADPRLRFTPRPGARVAMPGQGIWMGATAGYVRAHYAVHDVNVLLLLAFDPDALLLGRLDDREPEFTTREACLLSAEVFEEA